jgi:hypothetical protein
MMLTSPQQQSPPLCTADWQDVSRKADGGSKRSRMHTRWLFLSRWSICSESPLVAWVELHNRVLTIQVSSSH